MPVRKNWTRISVQLPRELKGRLSRSAAKNDRSESAEARQALQHYLDEIEQVPALKG